MGLATARAFAESGAVIVLSDRNEQTLRTATAELTSAGRQALGVACDVSDEEHVAALVERTVSSFGRLDFAFNNAGIQAPPADAADEPAEIFDRVNAVNLRGVWACIKHELRAMRHLRSRGIEVLEVERPKHRRRSSRSNLQKSEPSDAEAAARAVLAGEASGVPKSSDGRVEMIRALHAARRSAIKARTQAANQLQALRVTAPDELLDRMRGLSTKELICVAARFRLGDGPTDVATATKFALRSVARRYEALSADIAELEVHLDRLVAQAAPELVSLLGIATENAATLLIVAGDNPRRLRSEASFASLCGVSPIEASSGKVVRHRLNRGGNREANRARCT